MALTQAEFDAVQAKIDTFTSEIASRIAALVEQLKAGGLSEAQEQAVYDKLLAQAAALEPLGKSDEVPPLPPEV